jgi:heptosyltransferase-1
MAEEQQAHAIAHGLKAVQVLPHQPLAAIASALQERVDVVVGVDTGLTHLAAAFELPLVALFFATPAWRFAPCFNPNAISLGDVGHVPTVEAVLHAVQVQLNACYQEKP